MSTLLPAGITSLADAPFTIHDAIVRGLYFLSFDELPLEERPPKEIWMNNDKMKAWGERIKAMRKDRAEGREPISRDIDGPADDNDAAADLLV